MAWPPDLVVTTQTRRVELASSVWVTGNLESVGGILIKIWTNFNKNRDNTPTYLLDTAHKKHSLEIIWLDKKSPWSESGLATDGYNI